MNCSATLHEMCIMNIVGVLNEQVVFLFEYKVFVLSAVTIVCGCVKCQCCLSIGV
jgi:hypothetical protein